ncbi:hypothetical protein JOF56_001872 [Kibdelosporangium banguiense]|uniref:Uncharacterized protein n=1 Tax=Kibdelosporangium banguiense TaxID=1365924 RepID=A0ABS4TAN9_9PSEU|nr:hypothetical protein [Kibdelosporangium banguiense]
MLDLLGRNGKRGQVMPRATDIDTRTGGHSAKNAHRAGAPDPHQTSGENPMVSKDIGSVELWKFCPDQPFEVFGYPITCPGCGSSAGILFWAYTGVPVVRAQHLCVPSVGVGTPCRVRMWDEYRLTTAFVRERGYNVAAVVDQAVDEFCTWMADRRANRGCSQ